jgi:hypothetical protein
MQGQYDPRKLNQAMLTMMRPLELQTPMWPTKGTSQLMSGIGVHTIQCGKVLGGTMVLLSLFMLMFAVLNVLPLPH